MTSRSSFGLALVAALGMIGCGGGGDDQHDDTVDARVEINDASAPDAPTDAAPTDAPPDAVIDAPIDGPGPITNLHLVVTPATLELRENTVGQVRVALSAAPSAAVAVAIASSDAQRLGVTPTLVTFNAATWATPQVVTVNALNDLDITTDTVTLTLTAAGLPAVAVPTTILDDDDLSLVTSTTQVAVVEGATATLQVRLTAQPPANVVVTVSSANPVVATAAPAVLTFTPASWNVPQIVTIVAPQDSDAQNATTTVTLTTPGLVSRVVTVAVTDDDALAIVASAASLTVAEGASESLRVRLTAQPAVTITLSVASSAVAVATVSPATLTFTPTTWSTDQVVTVVGVQDADLADGNAAITISGGSLTPVIVAAHVDDDDVQNLIVTPVARTVREGTFSTFTVALSHPPAGAVDVNVVSADLGVVRVSPSTLTFHPQTYAIPQTVVLLPQVDANAVDDTTTVTLSTFGAVAVPVTVRVIDAQTPAILVSHTDLAFAERRGGQFGVRLSAAPTAPLTVTVISPDVGVATVMPATLTFTATTWADYQVVTVVGTDDADLANEHVSVIMTAAGWASAQVAVDVIDDDVPGLIVSRRGAVLVERATPTATASVSLSAAPTTTVLVTMGTLDPGVVTVAPGTLVFTPTTWSTPQTVTLVAESDADFVSETTLVQLNAPGVTPAAIAVTVVDDTQPAIVVGTHQLTLFESTFAVTSVRLSEAPTANVVVTVTSADPAVTVTPATLEFTPANWNTAVNVRLTAVDDANQVHETVAVTLGSAGWASAVVNVAVHDDDAP